MFVEGGGDSWSALFNHHCVLFQGFDEPHDVTVSPDGESIYIGEIEPKKIWKFMQPENE